MKLPNKNSHGEAPTTLGFLAWGWLQARNYQNKLSLSPGGRRSHKSIKKFRFGSDPKGQNKKSLGGGLRKAISQSRSGLQDWMSATHGAACLTDVPRGGVSIFARQKKIWRCLQRKSVRKQSDDCPQRAAVCERSSGPERSQTSVHSEDNLYGRKDIATTKPVSIPAGTAVRRKIQVG